MSTEKKPPIDRESIRTMVRQVLRDSIPESVRARIAAEAGKAAASHATAPKLPPAADAAGAGKVEARIEEIAIATDADLAAFVRRLLKLGRDPKQREAIEHGRVTFRLKGQRPSEPARSGGERIDKGLVTERTVAAAAKTGKRLVLGRRVVLTPLARDKARQLGVEIERE